MSNVTPIIAILGLGRKPRLHFFLLLVLQNIYTFFLNFTFDPELIILNTFFVARYPT